MNFHIIFGILVCSTFTLTKSRLKLSENGMLHIAMSSYIINQQISLNNFINVLKTFTNKYDDFAQKWIESGLNGDQMLNVEPLLLLATNKFENRINEKIDLVFKTLSSINEVLDSHIICFLCDIPIETYSEHDKLYIAMSGYIVNEQITVKNLIKVLKTFNNKYDNFAQRWINSGLNDDQMLNVEPLLLLATNEYENDQNTKIDLVFKILDNIYEFLDDRIVYLLSDFFNDAN
ncbi:uncharacterized protein LOC126908446 [Daktulosphaira vitifoliae]|uniref:uncharacterized protein LOC126908446 n=1 Tax=Daktulosphaira vitifoliae TaxID=58002 RepID=UPI0021AA1424|nr:uncharacterized protein LOC126908446 [Daktulosphaira vitifoliae]